MPSEHYETHHAKHRISNRDFEKEWFKRIITLIERNNILSKGNRHIDFGCSACELLEIVSKRFGTISVGADYPTVAVELARKLGFDAFRYDGNDPNSLPQEYRGWADIATSTATMEHLNDLDSMLKLIYFSLKDDGYFAFTVPNSSSYKQWLNYMFEGAPLDEGHHYRFLNRAKLMQLLVLNGFDVVDELHFKQDAAVYKIFFSVSKIFLKIFRPLASRIAETKYFTKNFHYLPEFSVIDWGILAKKDTKFTPIGSSFFDLCEVRDRRYVLNKVRGKLLIPGWISCKRFEALESNFESFPKSQT